MAIIECPVTLTRVGDFNGDFYERVRRFSTEVLPLPSIQPSLKKYGLFDDSNPPYLLIVSNSQPQMRPDYNVILTVTSESAEHAVKVADYFSRRSEIPLREAPSDLQRLMGGINSCFGVFKKNPRQAIEALKLMGA